MNIDQFYQSQKYSDNIQIQTLLPYFHNCLPYAYYNLCIAKYLQRLYQYNLSSMPISKTLNLLAPIKKSFSVRNPIKAPNNPKRTVSLKPSISKPCSAAVDMLPPIRNTIAPIKSEKSAPRDSKRSQKNNFDERILIGKERPLGARQQSKNFMTIQGMSKQALVQRKESHLNTYFNQRKSRLKQITKENKQIYVKINSQKSLYSSRELNRSTSRSSLSRRLSNSKLSRSNSQRSIDGKTPRKREGKLRQPPKQMHIQSHSIDAVQANQVNSYLSIFCNHINIKTRTDKKLGNQPLIFNADRPFLDKQNLTIAPSGGKLQKIIEQFNQRSKRKANILLSRLL